MRISNEYYHGNDSPGDRSVMSAKHEFTAERVPGYLVGGGRGTEIFFIWLVLDICLNNSDFFFHFVCSLLAAFKVDLLKSLYLIFGAISKTFAVN